MSKEFGVKIFLFYLLLFGLMFAIGATRDLIQAQEIKKNGIIVEGIVTKVYEASNTEMDGIVIEVSYKVLKNEYIATNKMLIDDMVYQVGENINVIYSKKDPDSSIIDIKSEVYKGWINQITTGFILMLIATALLIKRRDIYKYI